MNIAKRFFKESAIYYLEPVLKKVITFFLLPIYTVYLTPADYGNLQYIMTFGMFFNTFAEMGIGSSFWKFNSKAYAYSEKSVVFNVVAFQVLLSAFFLALVIVIKFLFPVDKLLSYIIIVYLVAQSFSMIYRTYLLVLRAKHRATYFLILSVSVQFLTILFILFFVIVLKMNYRGIVYSYLIIGVASAIYSIIYLFKYSSALSINLGKEMITYDYPIMLGNVFAIITTMSDRFFLKVLSTDLILGQYSFGYKFADLTKLFLLTPFFLAWNPIRWEVYERKDGKKIFATVNRFLLAFTPFAMIAIIIVSLVLAKMVTFDKTYLVGLDVLPIIAVSNLFYLLYYFNAMGMLFSANTKYITLVLLVASIVNLLLNWFLIPYYHMYGAAISTCMSYTVMLFLGRFFSQRFYQIRRSWIHENIIFLLLIAFAIFTLIVRANEATTIHYIAILAGFAVGYVVVIFSTGFVHLQELKELAIKIIK